ncbi:MBL fold metallo-hydrolase [Clostridium lundense]|uniref:MBL fold metallo-hydrolase n=1 Tax=Clostridium lundense TaxID=319475 RepID=UPI000685EFF6|nr:MBL fold metallo-hydrolase [Clostridium lundense]
MAKNLHFFKVCTYMYALHKRNLKAYFKKATSPLNNSLEKNSLQWIGHATVVINIDNKIIVTDPVLSNYLGHIKRLIKPSLDLSKIHIDYILLSHGHMDHLDLNTLRKLNKDAIVIVPKRFYYLIKGLGFKKVIPICPNKKIKFNNLAISVLESLHDGRRYYLGKRYNSNAYLIDDGHKKIFFPGDTAYTTNFKNLNTDIALMPVGCYVPDEFRKMHCSPYESFKMFKEMNGKIMIPIHYRTYILAQDEDDHTLNILKKINDGSIKILEIGETFKF